MVLIMTRSAKNTMDSPDRKSTRLNSSHLVTSYAVFCLKKKTFTRLIFWPPIHRLHRNAYGQFHQPNIPIPSITHSSYTHSSPHRPTLFFFNDPATTEIYTLSLHDALPILICLARSSRTGLDMSHILFMVEILLLTFRSEERFAGMPRPRSYAVFCLNK